MRKKFNIVLAESAQLYREGVKLALKGNGCRFHYSEVATLESLARLLLQGQTSLDLLLLDAGLISTAGMAEVKSLIRLAEIPVLMTCYQLSPDYRDFIRDSGVRGVIEKTTTLDEFSQAVMTLLNGGSWLPDYMSAEASCIHQRMSLLTIREHDVLQYLVDGLMNKQIAYQMSITEHTVKYHVSHILRKLKASSRTGLVVSLHQKPLSAETVSFL